MELKYFKKIQADGENDVFHEIDSLLQFSYTALKMSRLLNYSRPIEPLVSLPVEAETISQRTLCRKLADIYAFREQFFFFSFFGNRSPPRTIIRIILSDFDQSDWITKAIF